ncbi:hypothetical protein AB1N83_014269 [Pleurotus pulmonarius]
MPPPTTRQRTQSITGYHVDMVANSSPRRLPTPRPPARREHGPEHSPLNKRLPIPRIHPHEHRRGVGASRGARTRTHEYSDP